VNTYAGIRSINEHYVNLARLMGASGATILRRIMFPSAAPEILLGLRTSLPYAMIGAVVGEFIASNRGLGYFIYKSAQLFDAAGLFSGIIILVILVVGLTQAVQWLERRLVRWTPIVEARVSL
jgi:NitT/TauT family transport system permease protein